MEILSLCIRFVDKSHQIREEFIEFIPVEVTTGQHLANVILQKLHSLGLQVSFLRGQTYDGAAVMSGAKKGVQARIKQDAPLAVYTHCCGHLINLVLASSTVDPNVRNMIDKLKESCLFFNYSPKRAGLLKSIISSDEPSSSKMKPLLNLCLTRWSERQEAYEHFANTYHHQVKALEMIAYGGQYENFSTWDTESKSRAKSLLDAITNFAFLVTFYTVYMFLSPLAGVTNKLQGRIVDVIYAYEMVSNKTSLEFKILSVAD